MRQSHGVSASFPRRARSRKRGRVTSDNERVPRVAFAARFGRPIGSWRCTRWCARLPKLPRRKETWRHRDYVCALVHEYTCACVLACGRVHACVPVVPLGRGVRSPPSFLRSRYTSIFLVRLSSFLSSHSPFSFLPFLCLP